MKIKKIAVKDSDGVVQVARIGGGGGVTPELERIALNYDSDRVYPGQRMLTWEEVETLTVNTGIAPTAEEKEMYRDEDGGYTRKRIVYDGYISAGQAKNMVALPIQAYAKDPACRVAMYNWKWIPVVNSLHPQWGDTVYWMNNYPESLTYPQEYIETRIGRMRKGMDDMKVALDGADRYTAQQRVYIDVESPDGAVGYYVLVLHNAQDSSRGLYRKMGESNYKNSDGISYPVPGGVRSGVREQSAIWVYPAGTDMTDMPANAEVALTADEARAKLEAGETLTAECVDVEKVRQTLEQYPGNYPLVYKAKAPCCQFLRVEVLTESPLSDVALTRTAVVENDYRIGGIVCYPTLSAPGPGDVLYLGGRVRSQEESCQGDSGTGQYFELHVEFYVPAYMTAVLRGLGVLPPEEEQPEEPAQ